MSRFASFLTETPHRLRREYCHVVGCTKMTTGKKPYCIDHIDNMPYAKMLARLDAEREDEINSGKIVMDGIIATEILSRLNIFGPHTMAAMRAAIDVPRDLICGYMDHFIESGTVYKQFVMKRHMRTFYILKQATPT